MFKSNLFSLCTVSMCKNSVVLAQDKTLFGFKILSKLSQKGCGWDALPASPNEKFMQIHHATFEYFYETQQL